MYKIAVIGDKDSVLGFKALGFSTIIAKDANEAEEVFEDLVEDYAIIYIIEEYARQIKETLDRYREDVTPAIIPIPSTKGSTGLGMEIIRDAMERAVGADILFKDDE